MYDLELEELKQEEIIDIDRISIDVYYSSEEDFKNHDAPYEVIMSFPEKCKIEPIKFSETLINCFDVRDTTEGFPDNKDVLLNPKFRTAAIDVFGSVNYHVINNE